jgi:hypothetical protein
LLLAIRARRRFMLSSGRSDAVLWLAPQGGSEMAVTLFMFYF